MKPDKETGRQGDRETRRQGDKEQGMTKPEADREPSANLEEQSHTASPCLLASSSPCLPVFLIGYRGSGKTTVARLLAERLGWQWLDADVLLEQRQGRSIRRI